MTNHIATNIMKKTLTAKKIFILVYLINFTNIQTNGPYIYLFNPSKYSTACFLKIPFRFYTSENVVKIIYSIVFLRNRSKNRTHKCK